MRVPAQPLSVPIPPTRKPRRAEERPTLAQRLDVPIAVETGRPSKTRKKQVMTELQDLGEELVALPLPRLEALDLPDRLQDEIKEFHRTRSHEGKRRQRQLIGKLMRGLDVEALTRISELIEERAEASHSETALLHDAERWRDKLLADDPTANASTAFMAAFPRADLQHIRTLVRGARGDRAVSHQAMRAYRELFQAIKALQNGDHE